jgi:PAS domain S-box-containing protein
MIEGFERTVARLRTTALDDIPLGVVRLSTAERITYLNRAAREIYNNQLALGDRLADLSMDAASRDLLRREISERFTKQRGSSYSIRLLGKTSNTSTIIEVSAVPEYDEDGKLIGSIAFLRDLSLEVAMLDMHKVIASSTSWQHLLRGVAAALHKNIAFDSMSVTVISKSRNHLRNLIETDIEHKRAQPMKWWPMPEMVRAMLGGIVSESISVDTLFSKTPFKELAETDAATQEWIQRGFKHLLRYPVYHLGELVAIVSLHKTDDTPFGRVEEQIFRQLPIEEAVNIALTLDKKAEADFYLDVIQDLGSVADNANELQRRLVDQLSKYYNWEHVSLFSADYDKHVFRLVCQSRTGSAWIADGYEQPFDCGLLGEVLRTQAAVVVADVTALQPGAAYVEGMKTTRSEMCLPIPGSRLRWILNVESTQKDAFADEEQQSVELLLSVVGFILDRAAVIELKAALFDSVADGVVLTSREGLIEEINPAGARMFGRAPTEMLHRSLALFLGPPEATADSDAEGESFGESLIAVNMLPSTEVGIRAAGGQRIPALASAAPLPNNLGGKVFVLSDLTFPTRLKQLENLKQVFSTVASETRVPLALACTFLGDVANGVADVNELASKALAQLRKADLPLERLIRLSAQPQDQPLPVSVMDVGDTVSRLVSELPRHQANAISIMHATEETLAKVGFPEFAFCFQSILAFLLRRKAQIDRLQIKIENTEKRTVVAIQLEGTMAHAADPQSIMYEDNALREFSFPQDAIANLITRMGGEFHAPQAGDPRFVLTLPSA